MMNLQPGHPGRDPGDRAGRAAPESGAHQPGISRVSDLGAHLRPSTRHHGPPTIRPVSLRPQPVMINLG